ncbi:YIP1 family protein [Pseudosulfitobacter sp. SM2401]|uniref:Yip1 family protein n=1 Tax=Pseudosulfitobacter sp. SM2401 TaxID=3350098 RepID=UPI0036F43E1E
MNVGTMPVGQLIALSLQNPAEAARHVIDLRTPREVLWTLLVLACALNAMLFWVSSALTPPPPPEFSETGLALPAFLSSPILVFVFSAGGMVLMIHLLHWVGTVMGGTGSLGDMLSAFVWMQALRLVAQAGAVILLIVSPPVASLYGLVVAVVSLWITVNFINQGANLGSNLKTIGLLLIVMFGFIFGLSLFLAVTGLATMGL